MYLAFTSPAPVLRRARHCAWTAAILSLLLLAACTGITIPPAEEQAPAAVSPTEELAVPAAAAPDTERARQLTAQAQTHFALSEMEEAEQAWQEALAADPAYVPALAGLSDFYTYQPHRWKLALELAEQAHALAETDGTVLAHLAWAQQMAHHFDDAWRTAERAVVLEPDNFLTHTVYADILLSVYETDQALEHAQIAVDLNPDSALAWIVMSVIREALHDWAGAEEAALRAVELEPDFLLWQVVLSRLDFDLRGNPDLALDLAAEVIEALPDHPYVIGLQVDMAIETNRWAEAEAGCQQLVEFHTPETLYPDGFSCAANVQLWQEDADAAKAFQAQAEEAAWDDRFDVSLTRMRILNDDDLCQESRDLAQAWLNTRPYSIAAQRMMGVGFMCSDDFPEAIAFLTKTAAKLPRSVADARLLAIAYARNEMKSEATQTLAAVRSFAFDDPLYYQALYEINFILGDLEAAVENAQRWAVFRPYSTEAMEAIAFAHLYNGDMEAAQRSAQNAFDHGSTTSIVLGILGYANLLLGEFSTAEALLLESVEKDADMYLTQFSLSQLYQVSDRCEDSEPYVQWLAQQMDTAEERKTVSDRLDACYQRREDAAASEEKMVSDEAVQALAEEKFGEQDLAIHFFRVLERAGQRALVVLYASQEEANSVPYKREEIGAGILLATQLPLMSSQPEALILVSGTEEQARVAMLVVSTEMATLWLNDQITTEDFVSTWRREDAANMPDDIFPDPE